MRDLLEALQETLDRLLRGPGVRVFVESDPSITDWLMLLVTLVGTIGAILIGILTLRANIKANEANGRALRMQEQQAAALIRRSVEHEIRIDVRWEIRKGDRRSLYELRNVGEAVAFEVEIDQIVDSPDDLKDLYSLSDEPVARLEPGASLFFSLERSLASPPVTPAIITWVDAEGNRRSTQRLIS